MASAITPKMIAEPKTPHASISAVIRGGICLPERRTLRPAPLHMFFEPAEWKGKKVPRFTRIVDQAVIAHLAELEAIKARMYLNPSTLPVIEEWQL